MKTNTRRTHGLSLIEVALVVATLALLASFLLPALARPRRHGGSHISCYSHLKQIGIAYRLYSNDHDDKFSFATSNALGGTLEFVDSPQVAHHFESMSNELVTPKILVCPNDAGRVRASDFFGPIANSNVSYFVGLDAREDSPQLILSGDRNITGGTLSNGFLQRFHTNSPAAWTTSIHNNAGNIGLADGSAQQTTMETLRKQLSAQPLSVIRLAIP